MNLAEKLELAHALKELGVDVIEAGLSHRLARRLRGGAGHRPRGARARSSAAWPAATPPTSTAPGKPCRTAPGRASTCSWPPARSIASSSCTWTRTRSSQRAVAGVERAKKYCDDVEFSPEDATRTELDFLAEVVEQGRRRRGHHHQHPRHGRLCGARTVCRHHAPSQEKRARHRQGDPERPLPRRPGHGRRQQPGRRARRGPPGGMHHQRPGRTGRQLRPRRNRHGRQDPARLLQPDHAHQHAPAQSDQPARVAHHRHPGAAQQGDCRPKRLRP